MANQKRRAMSINEKGIHSPKALPHDQIPEKETTDVKTTKDVNCYFPWVEKNLDEQIVSGVALQPEVTDAQGDIYSEDVIRKAAHKFLSDYNNNTELGLMHKDFKKRFDLLESYIAPQDMVINGKTVKKGSWFVSVKVKDSKVWKMIKDKKITGFSIGGKAKVTRVAPSVKR